MESLRVIHANEHGKHSSAHGTAFVLEVSLLQAGWVRIFQDETTTKVEKDGEIYILEVTNE